MSEDAKIYVDPTRPATLHSAGVSTDWPTLRDAVMAWHRLRPEQARVATIRVIGGALYTAAEIPRLHLDSNPTIANTITLTQLESPAGACHEESPLWLR
jgi:hypothetical protein